MFGKYSVIISLSFIALCLFFLLSSSYNANTGSYHFSINPVSFLYSFSFQFFLLLCVFSNNSSLSSQIFPSAWSTLLLTISVTFFHFLYCIFHLQNVCLIFQNNLNLLNLLIWLFIVFLPLLNCFSVFSWVLWSFLRNSLNYLSDSS